MANKLVVGGVATAIAVGVIAAGSSQSLRNFIIGGNTGTAGTASPVGRAFFELAPSDGAGMGGVCACESIQGAKNETVNFTRSSAAYCTKHDELQNIVAGDMVLCAANQPRVMPGGDGTGAKALKLESTGPNALAWSEDFTKSSSWVSTVVITANDAGDPAGGNTADILDARGDGGFTVCQTDTLATNKKHTASWYVSGGTQTGVTLSMTGTGAHAGDKSCAATNLSMPDGGPLAWRRVVCTSDQDYQADGGSLTAVTTCLTLSGAGTVFAWGAKHEDKDYATSYYPTGADAGTRASDIPPWVAIDDGFQTGCVGATVYTPKAQSEDCAVSGFCPYFVSWGDTTSDDFNLYASADAGGVAVDAVLSAATRVARFPTVTLDGGQWTRVVATLPSATTIKRCAGENCGTATVTSYTNPTSTGRSLYIGGFHNGQAQRFDIDGMVRNVVVDPVSTRCQ